MKALGILAAVTITVAAAAGAWYVSSQRAPERSLERPPLYPGLVDRIPDVARVEIEEPNRAVTLVRGGDGWQVASSGGYPADLEALRAVMVGVASMRVLEEKTARPDLYPRLGVEDIGEGAGSVRLTLLDANGTTVVDLLVGKAKDRGGELAPGRYVRKVDTAQSLLVEGDPALSARPRDWMDTGVLDVPLDRVRRVVLETAGDAAVAVSRAADADFAVEDSPADMTVKSQAVITSLGSALTNLRFERVANVSDLAWPDEPTSTARFQTFDGLEITLATATVGDTEYTRVDARFDPALVVEPPAGGDQAGDAEPPPVPEAVADAIRESSGASSKPAEKAGAGEPLDPAAEAERLDTAHAPWAYVLPDFKLRMITRGSDTLLQPRSGDAPVGEDTDSD